jgi:DNA-binding response OmpR family regulator
MESASHRFILVVEAHASTAAVMARLVSIRGFRVLTAGSMAEARGLASTHDIGFLISELDLIDGDGCQLLAELHRQAGVRGAVITGWGRPGDVERSRAAGFMLHLTKPIEISDLEKLLALAHGELAALPAQPRVP